VDKETVLRTIYACGRERGVAHAASELEGCSPERARRILAAIEHGDASAYWDEVQLQINDPADLPSLNDTEMHQRGLMALEEAGLLVYDGLASDAALERAYREGYNDGVDDTVQETARRLLGAKEA
jgi:hypothetical protein